MNKKNKIIVLVSGVLVILLMVVGISFAVFSFNQPGQMNQQLVLGDIWMKYTETNGIALTGVMPGDDYNENNYFEFTISGINTHTIEDIWYDVVLTHGELPDGKVEANRVDDEYLLFKLVEVNNNTETVIFTDKSYSDLTEKRVHVATIPKNTTTEYNKIYRIYMTLSENLTVGNTEDSVMTMDEFENIFASVKVNVTGDFNEKQLTYEDIYNVTDASCF